VETLRCELGELHREVARRDVELLRALFELAAVNTELRKQIEVEQTHRADLTRAIDRLAMFVAAPALPPTIDIGPGVSAPGVASADQGAGNIIGGTIDPSSGETGTIDLTADLPHAPTTRAERPLECEVHLQFANRWISGFQIEETIQDDRGTQFRLRRQVDGWVLPELFDETEVRVFVQPVVDS
jgi:hypothetical protein